MRLKIQILISFWIFLNEFFYVSLYRHWLFGERIQNDKLKPGENGIGEKPNPIRVRGWFPRKCAVELVDPESGDEHEHFTAKKTN